MLFLDNYIKTGEIHALTIKATTLDESKNQGSRKKEKLSILTWIVFLHP